MKRLLPVLMGFAFLLLSSTEGWSLPSCPGNYHERNWNNCVSTRLYEDGSKYIGEWKYGKPHGQGVSIWRDGGKYVGEFNDNKRHGKGTLTYSNGDKYSGEWKINKFHGKGTYTWGTGHGRYAGDKYVGEFKDGKKHGQGTYTSADGSVKEGMWKNNQFKYVQKPSPSVTAKKTTTYNPKHLKRLKKTNQCPKCNLQGANLQGANLIKANLQGANLIKANLQGANLIKANLGGADLEGADLQGAKLDAEGIMFAKASGAINVPEAFVVHRGSLAPSEVTKQQIRPPAGYAKKPSPTVIGTSEKTPKTKPKRNISRSPSVIGTSEKTPKVKLKTAKQVATKTPTPKPKPVQKVSKRPDDIAVIIANSNYTKLGKDIPNVTPAYNDAENIKKYFMESLGVREGNIIYLKDATGAQLTEVFGNEKNHKAQLFDWVRPNKSNVHIYYAGHGAPASKDGSAYLVPSDAKSQKIEFSGYLLTNLYRNLHKIRARSVTVILEACFSGFSQGGAVLPKSSGIMVVAREPTVPSNVRVISAGAADQMASWEEDGSQSLFTKYFLKGMSGEGDKKPYGNGDGKVEDTELKKYLDDTMTYYARRYYGRDQTAQIVVNGKELTPTN